VTVPSVLLVPAAWHKLEHFGRLVDELCDLDLHTVTLASSGDDPAALRHMCADAEVIAQAVAAIERPVVVVAHSTVVCRSRLGYQSYVSMWQPLTETSWTSVPSTYVVCESDNAIPVAAQEQMAQRADHVERLNTSHSPFLSQPAEAARLIRRCLFRERSTTPLGPLGCAAS
jgi:hypothetical protein